MTVREKKKVYLYILLIIIISVALSIWGARINTDKIVLFVGKMGIWAPVVFIFILTLCQIFAPVSGTPIFLSGFIMFENKVQLYGYFAYLIAVLVNFSISRKWGRIWVTKLVGKDDMSKVDTFTKDYGLKSLIFLRLFQSHLSDFISYAYGLTNMKIVPYLIVSIVAPIPSLLIWNFYIFPRIDNITDFSLWFLITLIPLLLISWFYWKFINRNK